MLQLRRLSHRAERSLREEGALDLSWETMEELCRAADEAVARFRARRVAIGGPLERLHARLDAVVRCDTVERMDREDFPDAGKVRLVGTLHRFNQVLFSYNRWVRMLRPHIEALAAPGRPARLLELASGAGELALHLSQRRDLPLEVTGSDIQAAHVDRNNAVALARGGPACFRQLNAFDLTEVSSGTFDLVVVIQSAHHFSPGQLGMMIAQAERIGAARFVLVDGRRSLLLLGFLPVASTVFSWARGGVDRDFVHDSFVSARRFYSDAELSLVARLAAPGAGVTVERKEPGYSLLTVRYR